MWTWIEDLINSCMMYVIYGEQLYKSNTSKGGSNMSELDLSRKLEVGDLIVGECRCDPTKKGIVEVSGYSPYRDNVKLRLPSGEEIYNSTDVRVEWGRTVGAAIGFIEDANWYTEEVHREYHNWKHIPKSDFTWEVGDVLYGECACTPSKFVVFECCSVGKNVDLEVIDSWKEEHLKVTQGIWPDDIKGGESLNEHCRRVLSYLAPYNFREYNYKKYSKDEWAKRQASKFIRPGALIEKQEPKEHRFKKSDFKVTETDKEIRVTPKSRVRVDVDVFFFVANPSWASRKYVLVKFKIESKKVVHDIFWENGRVRWGESSFVTSYFRQGKIGMEYEGEDHLSLKFHQIDGALKTQKETEPILLPRTFYDENIEDIKAALREYLEQ